MNHTEFCSLLKRLGFDFYSGVPCSILKNIINDLSIDAEITYISATREDEALGIATGAYMGGKKPIVFMQNSGLGTSITALASLVILYKIPVLMIISWRGHQGKDAPEHLIMGDIMLKLLEDLNIPTKVLFPDSIEEDLSELITIMKEKNTPVAAVLRRDVIK